MVLAEHFLLDIIQVVQGKGTALRRPTRFGTDESARIGRSGEGSTDRGCYPYGGPTRRLFCDRWP